jgi:hypothetical protein
MVLSMGSSAGAGNVATLVFKNDLSQIEFVYLNAKTGQLIRSELVTAPTVHPVSKTFEHKEDLYAQLEKLLKDQLELPKGLSIAVVLPSLYSSVVTLPSALSLTEVEMALKTEVERSVLFRKVEPVLDWFPLQMGNEDSRIQQLVVGAYPQGFVEPLYDAIKALGFKPLGLSTQLSAAIRGLAITGTLQDDGVKRLICVLSESVFSICVLEGFHHQSVVDVPISTVSVNIEHLMEDIRADLSSMGDVLYGCQQCILIQNNVGIPTQSVVGCFEQFGEIVVVEQTVDTLASLGAASPLYPCSIEALGVALGSHLDEIERVDFLPVKDKNTAYVNKVRKELLKVAIGVNVLVLGAVLAIWLVLGVQNSLKEMTVTNKTTELSAHPPVHVDNLETVVQKVWLKRHLENQAKSLTWLAEIPQKLPSGVWVEEMELKLEDSSGVTLKGGSRNSGAVQTLGSLLGKPFEVIGNFALSSVSEETIETSEAKQGDANSVKKTPYFKWALATPVGAVAAAGGNPVAATPPAAH